MQTWLIPYSILSFATFHVVWHKDGLVLDSMLFGTRFNSICYELNTCQKWNIGCQWTDMTGRSSPSKRISALSPPQNPSPVRVPRWRHETLSPGFTTTFATSPHWGLQREAPQVYGKVITPRHFPRLHPNKREATSIRCPTLPPARRTEEQAALALTGTDYSHFSFVPCFACSPCPFPCLLSLQHVVEWMISVSIEHYCGPWPS